MPQYELKNFVGCDERHGVGWIIKHPFNDHKEGPYTAPIDINGYFATDFTGSSKRKGTDFQLV